MVREVHGHGYIILKIKMLWCVSLVLKQFLMLIWYSSLLMVLHMHKSCADQIYMHNCIGNEFIQVQATDKLLLGSFPPTDLD